MKEQNQTSEVALEAANRIYNALQLNPDFGTYDAADIIQQSIDAATAEVKKEEKEKGFRSETPATLGVVSEQTGDCSSGALAAVAHIPDSKLRVELAICNEEIEKCTQSLDRHEGLPENETSMEVTSDRLKDLLCNYKELEAFALKVEPYVADAACSSLIPKTLYGECLRIRPVIYPAGSEPLISSGEPQSTGEGENNKSVSPSAPSRKQEVSAETAKRDVRQPRAGYYSVENQYGEYADILLRKEQGGRVVVEKVRIGDAIFLAESANAALDAAARVEPTKKEEKSL